MNLEHKLILCLLEKPKRLSKLIEEIKLGRKPTEKEIRNIASNWYKKESKYAYLRILKEKKWITNFGTKNREYAIIFRNLLIDLFKENDRRVFGFWKPFFKKSEINIPKEVIEEIAKHLENPEVRGKIFNFKELEKMEFWDTMSTSMSAKFAHSLLNYIFLKLVINYLKPRAKKLKGNAFMNLYSSEDVIDNLFLWRYKLSEIKWLNKLDTYSLPDEFIKNLSEFYSHFLLSETTKTIFEKGIEINKYYKTKFMPLHILYQFDIIRNLEVLLS